MRKRIFVVDDDPTIRSLFQELLEEDAYEADLASNGLFVWDNLTATTEMYEVIVLDLQVPRMDGLQLIETDGKSDEEERKACSKTFSCTPSVDVSGNENEPKSST